MSFGFIFSYPIILTFFSLLSAELKLFCFILSILFQFFFPCFASFLPVLSHVLFTICTSLSHLLSLSPSLSLSLLSFFQSLYQLVVRFLITAFLNFLLCLLPTLFSPTIILCFFCPSPFHFNSYRNSSVGIATRLWDRHSGNCGHISPVACYCVFSKTPRPDFGPTQHLFKLITPLPLVPSLRTGGAMPLVPTCDVSQYFTSGLNWQRTQNHCHIMI